MGGVLATWCQAPNREIALGYGWENQWRSRVHRAMGGGVICNADEKNRLTFKFIMVVNAWNLSHVTHHIVVKIICHVSLMVKRFHFY